MPEATTTSEAVAALTTDSALDAAAAETAPESFVRDSVRSRSTTKQGGA
jgi:hypothetical protein